MTIKRSALLGFLFCGLMLPAGAAQASHTYQRDAAYNAAALFTLRDAESALARYFTVYDSWTSSRFTLVRSMKSLEPSMRWVVAGGSHIVYSSSRRNNPMAVTVYDIRGGRFGGVTFCVGSRGTMNYCAVMLGNAPTKYYSLAKRHGRSNGVANIAGAYGFGQLHAGSPSTQASFSKPVGPAKWLSGLFISVPAFTG